MARRSCAFFGPSKTCARDSPPAIFIPTTGRSLLFSSFGSLPRSVKLQRFGDDEGDVVVLFARAELADLVHDDVEKVVRGKRAVKAQGRGKAFFAEFLPGVIERFGDSIRIQGQDLARRDLRFVDLAIPSLEHTENRRGGF